MTHTDTTRALFRGVWDNPEDDTARLVYAESLDDAAGQVPCACARHVPGVVVCPDCRDWKGPKSVLSKGPWPCQCRGKRRITCPSCRGTGTVSDTNAERAAIIRVQVELARHDPERCPHCLRMHAQHKGEGRGVCHDRVGLILKQKVLLAAHAREWARVPCPKCATVRAKIGGFAGACAFCASTGDAMQRHGCTLHWHRGFVGRVDVPALSWVCERYGPTLARSDSQQSWRVTPWALAVAAAHPVTEFAFPFPELVFVGEGEVAAESGDLPKPLYELLCCDKRARHGLAVFADEPELLLALAQAAGAWVRDAVKEMWAKEGRP